MSEKRIFKKNLEQFCRDVLIKYGMNGQDAEITGKVLTVTDAYGIHSHGTKNLYPYTQKIKAGGIDPKAQPEIVREGAAFAVMDAKDGIGMATSYKAMSKAVKLAEKSGVGYVTVKNSCHFGAGAYYTNLAAQQGMLGIAMSNTDPNMVVPGGKGMTLGNNPVSYAFPRAGGNPVILDIALSATAALKINKAKKYHEKIPDTWMVDPEGNPTTDPQYYQDGGALLPVGLHKGYGLSMLVEALSALASGGNFCRDVKSWCFDLPSKNRVCHAFLAVNPAMICPDGSFEQRAEEYADYIKSSPKAQGASGIYLPGEMEWNRYEDGCKNGIPLPEDVTESLQHASKDTGLKLNWSDGHE